MYKIKVQQNLVYDKYTHQVIGTVDLGDPQLIFPTFNDWDALVSYILVYLRGILCEFEFSMAYFAAKNPASLLWDAVETLESTCDFKIIAAVSDGASFNWNFYRLYHHLQLDRYPDCDVVYSTSNLFLQ